MRRVSLAISFLAFALGGGFWASQHYALAEQHPIALVFGGLVALAIGIAIAFSGRGERKAVEAREPDEEAPVLDGAVELAGSASPYRAQVRRVLLAASPMVSGSVTAVVVVASLAASAVLVPVSVKLPRWIEAEIVLAIWWVIVGVALAVILYRGFRLRDDYV
jgi:hypothetical protein